MRLGKKDEFEEHDHNYPDYSEEFKKIEERIIGLENMLR